MTSDVTTRRPVPAGASELNQLTHTLRLTLADLNLAVPNIFHREQQRAFEHRTDRRHPIEIGDDGAVCPEERRARQSCFKIADGIVGAIQSRAGLHLGDDVFDSKEANIGQRDQQVTLALDGQHVLQRLGSRSRQRARSDNRLRCFSRRPGELLDSRHDRLQALLCDGLEQVRHRIGVKGSEGVVAGQLPEKSRV